VSHKPTESTPSALSELLIPAFNTSNWDHWIEWCEHIRAEQFFDLLVIEFPARGVGFCSLS
jgi:hypothetical protein